MKKITGSLVMKIVGVVQMFLFTSLFANPGNGQVITLDEAISIALQNNSSLKAASEALHASGYRVKKSRSDLFPKADLQFGYSRLDPGTVRRGNVFVDVGRALVDTFGAGDPKDIRPGAYYNTFSTSLQVVQPIYNGGANWAAVSLARSQESGKEHQLDNVRQQIILDVKTRYLQVLQAQELVSLAQKSLESSKAHLRNSQKMLEVGLRNRTDVLRWEVQKANEEGRLVEAENNLQVALAALKQVMGIPFTENLAVHPLPFDPVPLQEPLEAQIEQTRLRHPTLQATSSALDAQRAAVRLAWSSFKPKVNFVYQLGWEQNNTLALDSFAFWNAAVAVSLPIFHSFSNVAQVQEAKAELRRQQETKEETERLLTLALIRARLKVETAMKRFRIAQKTVQQSEENLRVVENTYEAGLATNLDLLDAQVVNNRTQAELINTRYAYWIARAELARAMGVLSE